eukprot:COSAG02_NODE_3422_length_6770_cov_24.488982_3_plen_108_part_00
MGATSAAKYTCRVAEGGASGCPVWLEEAGSLSVFLYATFGTAITVVVGYGTSLLVWPNTAEERQAQSRLRYSYAASTLDESSDHIKGISAAQEQDEGLQASLLVATS